MFVNRQIVNIWYVPGTKKLSKPDDVLSAAERYIEQNGPEAFEKLINKVLGEPTFMKPFAAALVQSMEKNLKVTSPLTSFKLLRWSHYLLKWSQFATLSKGAFSRLANAQAVLCQVLMDGSFRRRRTCKQLFIQLFSEPIGIYKMYIEEVRDLRISLRDSPSFLNLILDFTITSPSLSAEYKPVFLDLYVKTILYHHGTMAGITKKSGASYGRPEN
ncbi:protein ILITYHIA-like [Phragmites australis]|uniref:protein ILITYHIA-like n=1 Tax=Phragmites australis TaxID=29695 RepID=UPI002D78F5B8|nr:protein ILITYHIA-like [Phragmites australis]